jgi:hypothetical protein
VWIRVHELGAERPETAVFDAERNPVVNEAEARVLDRVRDALE